jgi:enoyl-CoA hydratase/carnithine racemase
MAYETIKYEIAEQILTITLNRPEKLNAFNATMQKEMIDAFDQADKDDNVRAIIVTGAGRGFCAAPIFPPAPTPLIATPGAAR